IREVAEGIKYIHSEGIVHCDLRGENIFLDSNLQCKIADTGLTQYTNTIITLSGSDYNFNYAAPELFLAYPESHEDHDTRGGRKTVKTDVYAFGCLYYAIFFDTVPFKGKVEYQIMRLVASEERPDRLESPRMEDSTWNLIQDCWKGDPSQRPLMKQIVEKLISPGSGG
ncbi:kinase-like domain-containing protein, partial [Amanita rubescens]